MMRISFAVLVFAALVTVGCMSGDDDDDDDGFECDFGQDDNQFGPNSPGQQCLADGESADWCLHDPETVERDVEWRCHCAPDSCARWRTWYESQGVL